MPSSTGTWSCVRLCILGITGLQHNHAGSGIGQYLCRHPATNTRTNDADIVQSRLFQVSHALDRALTANICKICTFKAGVIWTHTRDRRLTAVGQQAGCPRWPELAAIFSFEQF